MPALATVRWHAHALRVGADRRTVARIGQVRSARQLYSAFAPAALSSWACCVPALAPVRWLCRRALAQIGGFDSSALRTNSFWAHVGKVSYYQWRVTGLRIAWVVRLNPAAIGKDCF